MSELERRWSQDLTDLAERMRARGVACSPECEARLLAFCRAVADANPVAGIVSRNDVPELITKHVAASLGVVLIEVPSAKERWLDVGSGGGFPGLVLKLCYPESRIDLIDSSRKKVAFLEIMRDRFALTGMEIYCQRVEDLARRRTTGSEAKHPEAGGCAGAGHKLTRGRGRGSEEGRKATPSYDVIVTRAVSSVSEALRMVAGIACRGTRLITFKGPAWESELESAALEMASGGWALSTAVRVPWAKSTILSLCKNM